MSISKEKGRYSEFTGSDWENGDYSKIYNDINENPAAWVDVLSDGNSVKTDFFEGKSTAYAKAAIFLDDL